MVFVATGVVRVAATPAMGPDPGDDVGYTVDLEHMTRHAGPQQARQVALSRLMLPFMLWELSVIEQRWRAVLEACAGVPVTEVAERYG